MTKISISRLTIPPKFYDVLLKRSAPVKTFHSGRAGAKSHSFARALLFLGTQAPLKIVCGRQFMTAMKRSVKTLLDNIIKKYQIDDFYKSTDAYIRGNNGTEFLFMGLDRNPEEIKGLEGVHIFWLEEGQTAKQETIDILLPTILRNPGAEVWVSMNPKLESDPAYQTFIVNPDIDWIVVKTTFLENQYIDDETIKLAKFYKRNRPEDFDNIWMGNPLRYSEAAVFKNYKVDQITKEELELCSGPYYGMDFGHSIDPCTLIEMYMNESHRKLYITRELYKFDLELDDMQEWIEDGMPGVFKEERIIADSSRPETISFLCRRGGNVVAANKYPGSVLEGIDFIKNLEVTIDPDCNNTESEFINYSWKRDPKTGEILPKDPEDKHNHCMDAIRYGLEAHVLAGDDSIIIGDQMESTFSDW